MKVRVWRGCEGVEGSVHDLMSAPVCLLISRTEEPDAPVHDDQTQ